MPLARIPFTTGAPIAILFYYDETGPAQHESPEGDVDCTIELKRQFRISGNEIQLMIDSAAHMADDVLQEEFQPCIRREHEEQRRDHPARAELDEETINETSMEAVADELLAGQYWFQTFFEQTAALLEKDDEVMKRRIE